MLPQTTRAATADRMRKTRQLNVRIEHEDLADLKKIAEEDGRSVSNYVERLIKLDIKAKRAARAPKGAPNEAPPPKDLE